MNRTTTPLILRSLEEFDGVIRPLSHEMLSQQFESLNYVEHPSYDPANKSIFILDDNEKLLIKTDKEFMELLHIEPNTKIKVVSIFGNTGEGKSHTLNHAFFDGKDIFKTSRTQTSCTIGVWAFYNATMNVIFLDTEGLLGVSRREHQRTRLLLKILAVSDVIIYRTRAERLQRDMYTFLGSASQAYKEHFSSALTQILEKNGIEKTISSLGPGVIIFHETRYTNTLNASANVTESAEDIIRSYFGTLHLNYDGFSFIKYVGHQTRDGLTNFKELRIAVQKELESTEIRSPRDAKFVFLTLKGLNDKFQNQINDVTPQLYLPTFFTCQDKCLSCDARCILSMGHKDEDEPHYNEKHCILQHQYQNYNYLCKTCYSNGIKQIVEPSDQIKTDFWSSLSSVWAGYIIECPKCGKIYQSREYWYGNKDPKDEAVIIEIVHVWPGEHSLFGTQNSAQKVLDGVTSISNALASVSIQPKKMISNWVTDQIAPSYWRPNHEIMECFKCKTPFATSDTKHHCRACGEGFCEACSSKTQPVPSRSWYEDVRVCDFCYKNDTTTYYINGNSDETEVRARRIGETVINSISVVKSVLDIPKDFIKDTVRPTYWTPDNECINCIVCGKSFSPLLQLHHCRDCGKGVCDNCSTTRKPVPLRGWDTPVRVCDLCVS